MSKQKHSNTLKKIMSYPAGTEFNEFEETTSGTGRIWWHKLRICSDFSVTWQIINDRSDGPATVAWKGLYSIQKLMSALVLNSPFYNEELRFGFHVTFTYRKALFFYRYFSTL